MKLQRIEHKNLTPARKRTFVRRLLKLRDILIDAPPENYDHSVITEKRDCGTAACAVGHAVVHHKQFPGLPVYFDGDDWNLEYTAYPDWMAELYRDQFAQWYKEHEEFEDLSTYSSSDTYFGPFAWAYIFDTNAYPKPTADVTKYDAIQRIEDYITKVLGCELIPAEE